MINIIKNANQANIISRMQSGELPITLMAIYTITRAMPVICLLGLAACGIATLGVAQ